MSRSTSLAGIFLLLGSLIEIAATDAREPADSKIDRHALVTRHNVTITECDKTLPRTRQTPLQVGNGHFAFGLDVTGLQTFMLHGSFSHSTLSDWGWHTAVNPENYRPEETMIEVTGRGGRTAPYAANSKHHWSELPPEEAKRAEDAWNYYRQNPGRLPLGQIRFHLFKADGKLIERTDLKKIRQNNQRVARL